ncbi:hypothetical protein Tco_1074825 [Tanacetum coccineum]
MEITATIDGRVKTITESSIRRHLKLEDSDGINTLPTAEIFEQLALIGPKKTTWEQFSRNIATAIICLATNRTFNFSNLIFEAMDQGKGPTILVVSHYTPTSGPSTSQPPSIQTTPVAEEAAPMSYDSPLPRVHSLGSDEGSLSLNELTGKEVRADYQDKTSQAKRRAKVVISDTEEDEEDPSKQGGMLKMFKLTLEEEDQLVLAVVELVLPMNWLDHENAMKIQEELDAAERQKMAQVHQAAQGFTNDEWDDILARVTADKDFVQQLQACEKVSDEDLPRKLIELVNQRKKLFSQQRTKAKRNKPMTPAQQKEYMSTYIMNQEGGYTLKQLKALSFEEVKEIFEATMRKVQSFVPMDSELEVQRLKRAGQDVIEEPAKRQRTREASGVGGHTEAYQTFDDMLKKFDRDDLDKLWNLVKERFRTTEPTKDKARELWVELKRLFEPDDNDTLWKLQRYMHDPLNWWLYDTCGVHHVSTERGHDIYMLVEKDYPLTKALATLMLCNKLRVDQYSDMADELLQKINIIANRPRQ